MTKHLTPAYDTLRLAERYRLTLLDNTTNPTFDRLTRMATRLLQTSLALVGVVDDGQVFIKSQVGLPEPWASERKIPLENSFCQRVIMAGEAVLIEDVHQDKRLSKSPLTRQGMVAYAGVSLC